MNEELSPAERVKLNRQQAAANAREVKAEKERTASMPQMHKVKYLGPKKQGILLEFPMPFETRAGKTGEVRLNPEGELTDEQFEQFKKVLGESELFEILE